MPPQASSYLGCVLAGGRATRFGGGDKAMAPLAGRPMGAWAAKAIGAVAVAGSPALAAHLGLAALADPPGLARGPLAGVLAALTWAEAAGADWLVTAPCDAPLVPADLGPRLIAAAGGAAAAYATTEAGPHPLCAVWRPALAAPLAGALASGAHPPVRAFLAEIGAAAAPFSEVAAFANVNDRETLAALEAALLRRGPTG